MAKAMIEVDSHDEDNFHTNVYSDNEDSSRSSASDLKIDKPSNLRTDDDATVVKLIGTRLYIGGYVYKRNCTYNTTKIIWECKRYRRGNATKNCHARAMTSDPKLGEKLILYKGLKESQHNHEPCPREVREAEATANLDARKGHDSQLVDQTCTDHDSELVEDAVESESSGSYETVEEMDLDEVVSEQESKRPVRSSAAKATYTFDLAYDLGPTPPKLIGDHLNIDGFIYYKNQSYITGHLSKIRWVCKRSKKEKCQATAITSDPSKGEKLIVYRGPDESRHDHLPCRADVKEAEMAAECDVTNRLSKSKDGSHSDVEIIPADVESSPGQVSNFEETDEVEGSGGPERRQLVSSRIIPALTDPSNVPGHQLQVKLIGKRLCIDGYIYTKNSNGPGVNWVCRRYRKTGCIAKVSTSDPFVGEEFAIHKIDGLSRHNHSPCELEFEEAELLAKLDLIRSKLEEAEAQNGSSDVSIRNLHRNSHPLETNEKCASIAGFGERSSYSLKEEKRSSASRPDVNRKQRLIQIIGRRLCIDGYVYINSGKSADKNVWECIRYRKSGCPGRATTTHPSSHKEIVVYRGPDTSKHNHPPSPSEIRDAENFAKLLETRRISKSRSVTQVSRKMEPQIPQPHTNCRKSSEKIPNITVVNARSQSDLIRSKASRADNQAHVSRNNCQTKNIRLLQDHGLYRKFLMKFSKKPIFDRQNVIEALRIVYSSKQGCLMAYATVLENREKIERDLEVLKNNPKATIAALSSDSFTIIEGRKNVDVDDEQVLEYDSTARSSDNLTSLVGAKTEKEITSKLSAELNFSTALVSNKASVLKYNKNTSRTRPGEETEPMVFETCTKRVGVDTKSLNSQERSSNHGVEDDCIISPVLAALALKNLSSRQPSTNLSKDKSKMSRGIICIDLTADLDETSKLEHDPVMSEEIPLQSNQTREMVDVARNLAPFLQNVEQFTPHPNFANARYSPVIFNPFNYGSQGSNSNFLYTVNNVQIPVAINIANIRSNAAANHERFYAQQLQL